MSQGVWMSLERLRQLPLAPQARLALLQELLETSPEELSSRLPLLGELAEECVHGCEEAYGREEWQEAFDHHDALFALVPELAAGLPERAEEFWASYGNLLAFFTAAVHQVVVSSCEDQLLPLQRAELAWHLYERLRQGRHQPIREPDWLLVLEQQIVQVGASHWRSIALAGEGDLGQARERAVSLFERLAALLDPLPDWVQQQRQELIEADLQALLAMDPGQDPKVAAAVLQHLAALPVPVERQGAMEAALTRARLALELLAPPPAPEAVAAPRPASAPPLPEPGVAEFVLLPPEEEATCLQFNLRPLLEGDASGLNEALDDFEWHLPRGSQAEPAATGLHRVLEPLWRRGLRLGPQAFECLAQLAAAWQRRLADRLVPLPPLDWTHGLVTELGATELAVLTSLVRDPESSTSALAELRREHQNTSFWQQRQEHPWMVCPPPLEALRRLYVDEAYYASSQEPLASLRAWGRELMQALAEAEVWTDDAGCLGLWLAVAQELVAQGRGPLPPLGVAPTGDQLLAAFGGSEVVYVGDEAMGVQAAHRAGRCFREGAFGLRVLATPASRWPARPAGSFEESLGVLLEAVDRLYRERPFDVLLADCGAYRLPLLRMVHQRYGIPGLSSGRPMAGWLMR